MRKFLGCCSILLLVSCLDETRVDPATPSTFVRYINGGNHDRAVALEKADDHGYIILANSELKITDLNKITEKIKLVKVNQYGSVLWSKVIPETSEEQNKVPATYHANGIFVSDQGYIIVGETIQNGGKKELLIVEAGLEEDASVQLYSVPSAAAGLKTAEVIDGAGTVIGDVSGVAVTKANGKFLVLSSVAFTGVVNSVPGNMILAEVVPPTSTTPLPTVTWDYRYGSSASTLFNQIFIDSVSTEVIFGGTVTVTGVASQTDLRLVKAVQNSQGTTFDLNFGEPDRSERANGICRTRNGFAMVGSTDVANKTDRDIMFSRFSSTGAVLSTRTYPVYYPGTKVDVKKDEEGNDVCNTADNGFIILGTMQEAKEKVDDVDLVLGRGERDFYLMKVNAFGDIEWERSFGSRRDDIGVAVTQAEDGGYLILGSTNLANLWTITLIKTNSVGEIE